MDGPAGRQADGEQGPSGGWTLTNICVGAFVATVVLTALAFTLNNPIVLLNAMFVGLYALFVLPAIWAHRLPRTRPRQRTLALIVTWPLVIIAAMAAVGSMLPDGPEPPAPAAPDCVSEKASVHETALGALTSFSNQTKQAQAYLKEHRYDEAATSFRGGAKQGDSAPSDIASALRTFNSRCTFGTLPDELQSAADDFFAVASEWATSGAECMDEFDRAPEDAAESQPCRHLGALNPRLGARTEDYREQVDRWA